jgi:hypothetical protein
MPDIQPTSVTLKINKTSVMLYANRYAKLPGHGSGTIQTYLGSFPISAVQVPDQFESMLRNATSGRPERYQALMRRITEEVLAPARVRRELAEAKRSREAISNALTWSADSLQAIPSMQDYAKYIVRPELQLQLKELIETSSQLSADIVLPEPEQPTPKDTLEHDATEAKLQGLLKTVESACTEIAALLPESAKAFRRGYNFLPDTVRLVNRLWFCTSDAVAALSARRQFRRPRQWSSLRARVMGE